MNFRYETDRLTLLASSPEMAGLVADYLFRNQTDFGRWERSMGPEVFTTEYQTRALEAEQKLFLQSKGARYYLFRSDQPDYIIGNVSFAYINEDFGHRCTLGYKIDSSFRKMGYAYEACSFLIPEAIRSYHLHRIEADILPENEASIALIRKLGFEYEGVARNAHFVAGMERDHLRFSYI